MKQVAVVNGDVVWIAMVMIELVTECLLCELKQFLRSGESVFCVRCELRHNKQLRTAFFCVTMQHVVVISYSHFRTTDWSHLDFRILNSKRWTERLS
jgi:hypothetical protein